MGRKASRLASGSEGSLLLLPQLLGGRQLTFGLRIYIFRMERPCVMALSEFLRREITTMATLRKRDVSATVSRKLGGSRAQGEAALNAVLDSIQEGLAGGDKVVLTGFGSFDVRNVKARTVRAILGGRAGNLITVPAHKRVGFKAGTQLARAAQ